MGVNMSTYVGFTCGGPVGAVVGVLGLVAPSVIVILIISGFLKKFRDSKVVDGVFSGLRPASTALITSAGLSVAMIALFQTVPQPAAGMDVTVPYWPAMMIAALVFLCMRLPKLKKLHPIVYIALAAMAGIVFQL